MRAIAEGAGGADHGQREDRGDGDDAHAAARRRHVIVDIGVVPSVMRGPGNRESPANSSPGAGAAA